jgi:hypothetical protein
MYRFGSGFQPFDFRIFLSWGAAPGWYGIAPSALAKQFLEMDSLISFKHLFVLNAMVCAFGAEIDARP